MYPINVQQMFEPKDGTRSKINGTRSKMCKTPIYRGFIPRRWGLCGRQSFSCRCSRFVWYTYISENGTRTLLRLVHVQTCIVMSGGVGCTRCMRPGLSRLHVYASPCFIDSMTSVQLPPLSNRFPTKHSISQVSSCSSRVSRPQVFDNHSLQNKQKSRVGNQVFSFKD